MAKDTYHHGNLHRDLVEAATRVVETVGAEKLSLRAVARDAGVSPAAPYHHFSGKQALLCAVAEAGLRRFNTALAKPSPGADTPRARLDAMGRAYVVFANANPKLFGLFQAPAFATPDMPRGLTEARTENFKILYDAVTACLPSGDEAARRTACAAAWSLVHGIALLAIDRRLETIFPYTSLEDATAQIIERLSIGEGSATGPVGKIP